MAEERIIPADIREAVDCLTAAVLTLAMETITAQSGHSTTGETSEAVQAKVFELYKGTLHRLHRSR